MKHHLLTFAILLMALVLYVIGLNGGGAVLVCAGAALELWFWVRAMREGKPAASSAKHPGS
jgi:hypothetical protein